VSYLFRVTDENGNTATCFATYESDDNIAPEIVTEAQSLTLECNGGNQSTALQAWLNDRGGAVATDACGEPITWTNNFIGDLTNTCGTNGSVEVVFRATEDCGNSTTTMAMFTIEDTTAPSLECPDDITLECASGLNEAITESWLNGATSFDICDGTLEVTHNYGDVFVEDCGLTGVHTVTFTVVDECGNETTCDRTITIVDTTAPDILLHAEDLMLECDGDDNATAIVNWLADIGGVRVTDECSDEDLMWTILNQEVLADCGDIVSTKYTFQVSDNCGNTNTTEASIILNDSTGPELTVPEDQFENCAGIVVSLEDWLNEAVATDDCGDVTIETEVWNTISGCGDANHEVYLFTATDACGNQTTGLAEYSLIDNMAPIIDVEAQNFTSECDGASNAADILGWLNNNGYAEASDNCGELTWENDYGSVDVDCGTTGEVPVTFTVTDECGNSSTTVAIFTINDTTVPTWEILPQNLEIECDGSDDPMGQITAWLNTAGGADVEDECSFVVFSNNFATLPLDCDQEGGVEVTFIATDACGNSSTNTAMLTITDDVAPEITSPALDLTVECDGFGNDDELQEWLDTQAGATAEDACSPSVSWNYTLISTNESCGETLQHTYEFTATDACGNVSANTIGIFTIEDTTGPVISPPASGDANSVVECDGMGNVADLEAWLDNHGGLTAVDDCSLPVPGAAPVEITTWEYDLINFIDGCPSESVYRFIATDDCGNTSSAEASFMVIDSDVPEIIPGADMSMEECNDPPIGNFPDFDFWLNNNAGATSVDMCSNVTWSNDYHPDNWVFTCGNTRYVDVVFTVTDACDNSASVTHQFGIGDVSPPEFTNCPRPPVIVDAPDSWCSAYVNFEIPDAEDLCGGPVIVRRVDGIDLNSGDLFPVGLTILSYEAEDECGNISSCELKIIVNDFHTEPEITCPEEVTTFTEGDLCGARPLGLAPTMVEDNCPDNMCVIYQILDENDNIVAAGTEDASGEYFPNGVNTLIYAAIDQPLLLITEVVQDGVNTGIEITNFGPANLNISCLDIVREAPTPETYNVPNGTVLAPGQVYTQEFTTIAAGAEAGYYIAFADKVIDGVSMNGYAEVNYQFTGSVFGDNVTRLYIWDNNNANDFEVANPCMTGSYGLLNPGLPICPPNGTTVGLQEGIPGIGLCSSTVTVVDNIAPFCAEHETTVFELSVPIDMLDGCTQVTFDVSESMLVADVRVMNLLMNLTNVEDLSATLISPSGTELNLFDGSCPGSTTLSASLSDDPSGSTGSPVCNPTSLNNMFLAQESFKVFFNESAQGTWTISISHDGLDAGSIQEVSLEIITLVPYAQQDIVLDSDPGSCGALFTWAHPMFSDNCCIGEMSFAYESEDALLPPVANGDFAQGAMSEVTFGNGTTTVVYTSVDQYGNESQCSFDVTVRDVEAPTFRPSDCSDRVYTLAAGECLMPRPSLFYPLVDSHDNCDRDGLELRISPDFADGVPIGDHTVTMTLTDRSGNSTSCTYNIRVEPYSITDAGDAIACVGEVNLSLGPECMSVITPEMVLSDAINYGCTEDFCVRLTDEFGNEIGSSESGENFVTEEHIGQQILVEICVDCDQSNCCWAYVNVENKLIPDVICPDDITIGCNQTYDVSVTGEPVVESCEQEIFFNYEDAMESNGMCDDPVATLVRTWYITDESGNTITCDQNISIKKFDLADVVMPVDHVVTDTYTCQDVLDDPTLTHPDYTGYPTIEGVSISDTGDGLCSQMGNS